MKICKAIKYNEGTRPAEIKYYSSRETAETYYENIDDSSTVMYVEIEVIDGWCPTSTRISRPPSKS